MADRNPLVQQLEDRNTAYAVMRAIEHHGGPSVLVCDPATRASVAVIFPIAEWDAMAKIHNETVDELEALKEEVGGFIAEREFHKSQSSPAENGNGTRWYDQYAPKDPVSPGVHNLMDVDYSEFHAEEVAQEGPKAVERKNLQRRVKDQRKQLDMLTEQAKGRKKEISYWKAVAQANLDTLNHYGIKAPKIKTPPLNVDADVEAETERANWWRDKWRETYDELFDLKSSLEWADGR
jgi:hypothetical protein